MLGELSACATLPRHTNGNLFRYLSGISGDWHPTRVTASGSTGTATSLGSVAGTEDTISLLVDWESGADSSKRGTAVYTASWTAPNGCEWRGHLSVSARIWCQPVS